MVISGSLSALPKKAFTALRVLPVFACKHGLALQDAEEDAGAIANAAGTPEQLSAQPNSVKGPSVPCEDAALKKTDSGASTRVSGNANITPANQMVAKKSGNASKPVFKAKKRQVSFLLRSLLHILSS